MAITGLISGIAMGTLNTAITVIIVVLGAGILVAIYLYMQNQKKYDQFDCIIFFRDAFGVMQQTTDKAGIFIDKITGNKRFWLKAFNVGLSPDNVKYVYCNGRKKVYLFKKGLKNFSFLKINVANENQIKLEATEEDVNWAINEYQKCKSLDNKANWQQWLPYISLAITAIVILMLFVWFFKQFPILKEVAEALKIAAQALQEGATKCNGVIMQ